MSKSEQPVRPSKLKLKYCLMEVVNNSDWHRSRYIVKGESIPIKATLDIRDVETRVAYYKHMRKTNWGPNVACYITIGLEVSDS